MAGNKEKNFASAVVYVKNDAVRIGGFLKGVVNPNAGGFQVDQENSWQQEQNKQMGMISLILGGIQQCKENRSLLVSPHQNVACIDLNAA